jgi:hypothetical protein
MNVMEPLFSRFGLFELLRWQEREALIQAIDSFDANRLLNTGINDLIEYFVANLRVEPLHIFPDQISVDQREVKIDISQDQWRTISDRSRPTYVTGTRIIYFMPYEGDQNLLYARPSHSSSSVPHANVTPTELQFIYDSPDHDAESVKSTFERQLGDLKQYLEWSEQEIAHFNSQLTQHVQQLVEARRQKLLNDRGMVASLGFPLRKRDDAPTTFAVPVTRKKIVTLPPATTEPFTPEPTLEMAQYEQILSTISNMVMVIERSPSEFHNIKEEGLRSHFLVQLNGQYEGQATGETFNAQGKTDILIRQNDKNIFIAECKFWRGEKVLLETITQLLSYASWRDTKTAILIFNRNKNFSEVVKAIPDIVKKHHNFKRQEPYNGETNSRYVFGHINDPTRELIITVMAFDVPGAEVE